jgi:hypothetical protein
MSPEDAANFERTLELGKQLALDLSDDDVLGRWMAHHISDLISKVGASATDDHNRELRNQTADLIIRFWAHRAAAPLRSRPTYTFQAVLEALGRLGGEQPRGYFRRIPAGGQPEGEGSRASLLRLAVELDSTVGEVVRHIIVAAAEEAAEKEADWLGLTEHLDEDDDSQLLRLARELYAGVPDAAPVDADNRHASSIAALLTAERRLAEVREALMRES